MIPRFLLPTAALVVLAPAAVAIEPSELKPGLAATFRDSTLGPAVCRIEATVALSLAPGETAHPRLSHNRLTRWTGYINVVRPGQYRFSAAVRGGSLAVQVNGRTVLTGQAEGK